MGIEERSELQKKKILKRVKDQFSFVSTLIHLREEVGSATERKNASLSALFYLVCIIEALLGILISEKIGGFGVKITVGNRYTRARKIGLTMSGEEQFLCVRRDEKKNIEQIDLQVLIDIAHRERVIAKRDTTMLHRLRRIRNGIHPMNTGANNATGRDVETALRAVVRVYQQIV